MRWDGTSWETLIAEMLHLWKTYDSKGHLDEGLRSKVQWNRAILLDDESPKLGPWPLDAGPRPKSGKSRLNLHAPFWRENQLVWTKKQTKKS
jgi:hypothetical protein